MGETDSEVLAQPVLLSGHLTHNVMLQVKSSTGYKYYSWPPWPLSEQISKVAMDQL